MLLPKQLDSRTMQSGTLLEHIGYVRVMSQQTGPRAKLI